MLQLRRQLKSLTHFHRCPRHSLCLSQRFSSGLVDNSKKIVKSKDPFELGEQPREAAPQRYPSKPTQIKALKRGEPGANPPIDLSGTEAYELEKKGFQYIETFSNHTDRRVAETSVKTAMSYLQDALEADPHICQVPHIHYGIGLCYIERRTWTKVQEHNQLALDANPDFVPSYEAMGEALQMQGQHTLALGWYTKFLDTFIEFYSAFGDYSFNHLPCEVIMGQVLFKRGMCYYNIKDYQMAAGDWNSLIELDGPLAHMAYGWLAEIAIIHKKYWEAVSLSTKAIERNPKYMKAYLGREVAYTHLNKPEEAEADRKMFVLLRRERSLKSPHLFTE